MGYLKTGIAWVCLADLENLVVDMTREHTMPATPMYSICCEITI